MSETESGRPRRALHSSDAGHSADAGADDQHEVPGERHEEVADDGTDDLDAPNPSRAWAPADGDSAGPDQPQVTTPIPPPLPTLPEPLQPPEEGRRFSAEPVTEDWVRTAPRRSAASVSSPPPPDEPDTVQPLASPATIEAAVVEPDGASGHPKRRLWIIAAAAAVVAVVVGSIIWMSNQRTGSTANPVETSNPGTTQSASPPAPTLDDTQLMVVADLAKVRKATTWTQVDASATPATQPACLELSSTGGAAADIEVTRRFTANQASGTLVQVAQSMADPQSADTAYDALLAQAASCAGAHILATYRMDGLANNATALTFELPDGTRHTLVLARTGRFINVTDASVKDPAAVGVTVLSTALAKSLAKQCSIAAGTCPVTPKAAATPPPPTDTIGWLALVDLPQLTPGQGSWAATDPKAPDLVGSQCEDVDLNKLSGPSEAAHRTYLLTGDAKAPESFGIDQAIYTFSKASAASAMAKTLNTNFANCGERTRTATVASDPVTALDAGGKDLKATSYLVTQRISDTKTVTFRVGISAVGTRLVYLLANPSAGFDFSQKAWDALVGRASQRATQFE